MRVLDKTRLVLVVSISILLVSAIITPLAYTLLISLFHIAINPLE